METPKDPDPQARPAPADGRTMWDGEDAPAPRPPAPALRARLVVVAQVVHVPPDGGPTPLAYQFGRELETDEQPYGPRRVRAGAGWEPLDYGWLGGPDGVGLVVVENEEGRRPRVVPTPEERADTLARVVELGVIAELPDGARVVVPFARVRPGEARDLDPAGPLAIRCTHPGGARASILLIPR
jgi:hypothetical protein